MPKWSIWAGPMALAALNPHPYIWVAGWATLAGLIAWLLTYRADDTPNSRAPLPQGWIPLDDGWWL